MRVIQRPITMLKPSDRPSTTSASRGLPVEIAYPVPMATARAVFATRALRSVGVIDQSKGKATVCQVAKAGSARAPAKPTATITTANACHPGAPSKVRRPNANHAATNTASAVQATSGAAAG